MARTNRQQWITHGVERTARADARQANIAAGRAVATAIRTTLGPNGSDKMLIGADGTVIVTNDGASILARMDVDDPIAEMLVSVAAAQDQTVGDGTTTAVLLTGELLAATEELLSDGLHPTTILAGYHHAVDRARKRLDAYGIEIDRTDDEALRAVARTPVTGRWDDASAERFADLATRGVRAVETGGHVDVQNLTVTALPGGELRESELVSGLLVDMDASSTTEGFPFGLPRQIDTARLALVDTEITVDTADAIESVTVSEPEQRERLRAYESETREDVIRTLVALGVDVLFCQKSIDTVVRTKLANEGMFTVERTRQDEFDALSRATEATAVQSVTDLTRADIGRAGSIERRSLGGTELLTITDCPGERHVSLLLRGGTEHVAEETQRIIEDCIAAVRLVLHDGRVLPGGGATEMALARDLSAHADTVGGREQLAIKAFAEALEGIPRALIANAGLDPIDELSALRSRHEENATIGIDPTTGKPRDMVQSKVFEPPSVKDRCLTSALGATSRILRVDDIIRAKPSDSDDTDHGSDEHTARAHRSTDGYPWAIGH